MKPGFFYRPPEKYDSPETLQPAGLCELGSMVGADAVVFQPRRGDHGAMRELLPQLVYFRHHSLPKQPIQLLFLNRYGLTSTSKMED